MKVSLAVFAAQRLQADRLPIPEAVPSKSSLAQANDVVKDAGGVKGGEFSVSDSDKVLGRSKPHLALYSPMRAAGIFLHDKLQMMLLAHSSASQHKC